MFLSCLLLVGKSLFYVKSFWKSAYTCLLKCFRLVIQGFLAVKRKAGRRMENLIPTSTPLFEDLTQPLIQQDMGY